MTAGAARGVAGAPRLVLDGGAVLLSRIAAVNVAEAPQRSPLRYPGGKIWLIPHIREWLSAPETRDRLLVEPFAGGGTVSLTAVMEEFAERDAQPAPSCSTPPAAA